MALQKAMLKQLVPGIVGEFSDDSPKTARAYLTEGVNDTTLPVFGKMFAFEEKAVSGTSVKTTCAKQGASTTTWTMGILVNPKEHYQIGFAQNGTVMQLAKDASGNYIPSSATIALRGHIWVMASTKTRAGAAVYVNGNGDLGDSTLTDAGAATTTTVKKLEGARWLRTVALATGKTEVLSEIAIDNPAIASGESGGESV